MYMNISYINICKMDKNIEKKGKRERERGVVGGGV